VSKILFKLYLIPLVLAFHGCSGTILVTSAPPGATVFRSYLKSSTAKVAPDINSMGTTPCSYPSKYIIEGAKVRWPDGVESPWQFDQGSRYYGKSRKFHFIKPPEEKVTIVTPESSPEKAFVRNPKWVDVQLDSKSPEIIIIEPSLVRGIKRVNRNKSVLIRGIANDDSGINEVLVNGKEAGLDRKGCFSSKVLLAVGDNKIIVRATDTKGNVREETFTIIREEVPLPIKAKSKPTIFDKERYYALLIGCNDYLNESIVDLDYPCLDVKAIAEVLTKRYSFNPDQVVLLLNPTRKVIISEFERLGKTITEHDNLLIFYAGHGFWDEHFKQGYWLPIDASKENRSEWISNGTVRDFIRGIRSRHTLLIADACFSGAIFKSRKAFTKSQRAFQELHKLPSRKAIASSTHSMEVPDRSVFVEYLIKRLKENTDTYFSSEQLFANLRQVVIVNSPTNQVPQYGEIREAGDEGGDFVFVLRKQ